MFFYGTISRLPRAAIVAVFAAVSLYLSSIEYVLPRPVPFFRFGLSNIPLLIALRTFSFADIMVLVLLKVLGLGLLNGTIASYIFLLSLSGSVSGVLCMYAFVRCGVNTFTHVGISTVGAMASNIVQTAFAVLYVFGRSAWVIAPYLLALGLLSGFVVGALAQYFECTLNILPALRVRYEDLRGAPPKQYVKNIVVKSRAAVQTNYADYQHRTMHSSCIQNGILKTDRALGASPLALLLFGIAAGIPYAVTHSLAERTIQVFVFFAAARTVKRIKILYFLLLTASVTVFYSLIPNGRVLISWGSFSLTEQSLRDGLFHALTLCGYVFLSLWCISPRLKLPGRIGALMSRTLSYFYLLWGYAGGGEKMQYNSTPSAHVVDAALFHIINAQEEPEPAQVCARLKIVKWYVALAAVAAAYASFMLSLQRGQRF